MLERAELIFKRVQPDDGRISSVMASVIRHTNKETLDVKLSQEERKRLCLIAHDAAWDSRICGRYAAYVFFLALMPTDEKKNRDVKSARDMRKCLNGAELWLKRI